MAIKNTISSNLDLGLLIIKSFRLPPIRCIHVKPANLVVVLFLSLFCLVFVLCESLFLLSDMHPNLSKF